MSRCDGPVPKCLECRAPHDPAFTCDEFAHHCIKTNLLAVALERFGNAVSEGSGCSREAFELAHLLVDEFDEP